MGKSAHLRQKTLNKLNKLSDSHYQGACDAQNLGNNNAHTIEFFIHNNNVHIIVFFIINNNAFAIGLPIRIR